MIKRWFEAVVNFEPTAWLGSLPDGSGWLLFWGVVILIWLFSPSENEDPYL